MMPSPASYDTSQAAYADAPNRLAARIKNMSVGDPVPAPREKTLSPGTLLLVVILGCIAIATLGNWLHTQSMALNDAIVKSFLVFIPLLLVVFGYFAVRIVVFWRESRAAEKEAMAEAEAEVMQREARFAAGRIKGDRRLCIRPLNPAKRAARRRRRADRLRTA
jgi:hypothetical protein